MPRLRRGRWFRGERREGWRPSAAKAAIDFATLAARLKPRPFKAESPPKFFQLPETGQAPSLPW
jgi:hypothetical protein